MPRAPLATIVLAAVLLPAAARAAPPEARSFELYKFQQRIGREDALVARDKGGAEIRTVFSFTDRTTPVPLAATLRLGADGRPLRFQVWGSIARGFTTDDLVTVEGNRLTIIQRGETRTEQAPPLFFVGSAYAPVIMTEELLRFWAAHGQPERLAVFPIGEVTIERRGEDRLTDDDKHEKKLSRVAIGGLVWGHETVWLDETGALAGLVGIDAEFDHFEAIGRRWSLSLERFVELAATDGMAALAALSPGLREGGGGGVVAYTGGRLIDGAGGPPVADAVVVTDGERIVAAGPRGRVAVPPGARTVEVGGKTLVPGLWDMHAHFEQVEWGPIYLAAGVTTVRDCGNELDFIRSVRDAVAAGKGVGPRILLACIVDGDSAGSIGTSRLRSAAGIPALIAGFRKAGCAQVKIYQSLDPQLIAPLARAAHAARMTVTGHVPTGIGAEAAVRAGLDQINHIQFVMRAFLPGDPNANPPPATWDQDVADVDLGSPQARQKIAFFAAHKLVLDPTMALRELLVRTHDDLMAVEPGMAKVAPPLAAVFAGVGAKPDEAARKRATFVKLLQLVQLLHKAGVTIVAGTDQTVPGHSLHREIELYVEAGFTPMEAIQAATSVPARVMKLDKEVGTITAGKRADFIIVEGDPLADVRALRNIVSVVAGGKAYDPAALWRSAGFTP